MGGSGRLAIFLFRLTNCGPCIAISHLMFLNPMSSGYTWPGIRDHGPLTDLEGLDSITDGRNSENTGCILMRLKSVIENGDNIPVIAVNAILTMR